ESLSNLLAGLAQGQASGRQGLHAGADAGLQAVVRQEGAIEAGAGGEALGHRDALGPQALEQFPQRGILAAHQVHAPAALVVIAKYSVLARRHRRFPPAAAQLRPLSASDLQSTLKPPRRASWKLPRCTGAEPGRA